MLNCVIKGPDSQRTDASSHYKAAQQAMQIEHAMLQECHLATCFERLSRSSWLESASGLQTLLPEHNRQFVASHLQ